MGWVERKVFRRTPSGTIVYTDPLHAGRHPFQTYMLALCILSSLPRLAGQGTSGAIESSLPTWLALAWALSLLLGASVALLGSFWPGDYDMGLFLERTGLDVVGLAALAYGVIIFIVGGWLSLLAAAIILGFALSCLTRARDIARIFHRASNGEGR